MKTTIRRITVMILAAMVLPWVIPPAAAATTAGMTVALINPEQTTHELSSAVPAFGFGMTADTAEALDMITIEFSGWYFTPGDTGDLAPLNVSASVSGVGIYRDSGSVDDELDASDVPVTADAVSWSSYSAIINLTRHNEPVPASTAGNISWIIVIRTSNSTTLRGDEQIDMAILADNIVASSAGVTVTQPAASIYANTLYLRPVVAGNFMSTFYIGPAGVELNKQAVLGIALADGGKATNYGVSDRITGLKIQLIQDGGAITSSDLAPITTDSATSGIGLYYDNGDLNDEWDANDTPINFATISPTAFQLGGVTFDMTFSPSIAIPDLVNGSWDFFVVVRSGTITSGDAFYLTVPPGGITFSGLLPSDGGHTAVLAPFQGNSDTLYGDDTPPRISSATWSESSLYMAIDNSVLYFNHLMPSRQNATVLATVCDSESDLKNVSWSSQPDLAGSPAPQNLSGGGCSWSNTISGVYGFDSSSSDAGSPVDFMVRDHVGNLASATEAGFFLNYTYKEDAIIIRGSPGWYSPSWPLYIDDQGTLWFSDKGSESASVRLSVVAASLYGGGIKNVSASVETGIDGPSNPYDTWGPGANSVNFYTQYQIRPNSTTDGAVTVRALDHSGNSVSKDFQVRRDTDAPSISILSPIVQSTITGNFVVRATITDSGAGVSWANVGVDPNNESFDMTFDGTNWYWEIPSNTFTDGPHTIIVRAGDHVNNRRAETVNVVFGNGVMDAVAPRVGIVSPRDHALVSGTTTVQVMAQDNAAVGSVWARVGQGALVEATFNAATGYYELAWETAGAVDGENTLSAIARDSFGNEATSSITVRVDNTAPRVSVAGPAPSQEVSEVYTVRVFASDAVGLAGVTLVIAGRTVDMAYNPSTGYYEYAIDTRSLADGTYAVKATVTDTSGKVASTQDVTFNVKNSDAVRSFREMALPLFFLFAVIAFIVVLALGMRGTFRKWMAPAPEARLYQPTAPPPQPPKI